MANRHRGARKQPFEGLKVADFAWVGVGPIISKALVDHGATVVHVESASRPDVLRLVPPYKGGEAGLDRAQFMANFNTSKLGLSLDMGVEEGRGVARQLADWADVVVESFTPGTMRKFGLDYETLSADRPDLTLTTVLKTACVRHCLSSRADRCRPVGFLTYLYAALCRHVSHRVVKMGGNWVATLTSAPTRMFRWDDRVLVQGPRALRTRPGPGR